MTTGLQIAIDASRTTVARTTGTEHYALELLRHLVKHNETLATPHHLSLYFRGPPAEDLFPESEYVTQRVIPLPRLWTHLRFASTIWQQRPDVTFVPAHTLPFVFPGSAVVTVHDLGYKYFPETHTPAQRRYLEWTTRYSAQRANRILADSQATADDLSHFYQTPAEKIRIVYPGVERPPQGDRYQLYQKYTLPYRYFLFIGTLQPRKNIERIVKAFQMWHYANPNQNTGLVLAGKTGWLFDHQWVTNVDEIYMPGYIDEADKGVLISNATALLFPSLHEGFGFPVVEAMLCGTPVIASNSSSLPELVGDAGILVNPLEEKEIAAAMDLLTDNVLIRRTLRVKGLMQARQFSWRNTAEKALQVLEEAAHER